MNDRNDALMGMISLLLLVSLAFLGFRLLERISPPAASSTATSTSSTP